MDTVIVSSRHGDRRGRPLLVTPMEAVVFALVAAALIATAALPAMVRHPHYAEAKTVSHRAVATR
jgi:hypothetical protein